MGGVGRSAACWLLIGYPSDVGKHRCSVVGILAHCRAFGSAHFSGQWHVLDTSYREIATIDAGKGTPSDLHDIALRTDGTAMVESYVSVPTDLSASGGKKSAAVLEAQIQRIKVSDGAVLFSWRSLKDFPLTDSYLSLTDTVDYIHVNALSNEPNYSDAVLVSARNISQVFKLNIKTGAVEWKVGAFRVNPGAGTVTEINDAELRHEPDLYGDIQGDTQLLDHGNTLVYFAGHQPTGHATEFDADGTVVQEITAPQSYRVLKYEWTRRSLHRSRPGCRTG